MLTGVNPFISLRFKPHAV